ncbi:MAG: sulfurtransferase TusA family protein, partial [Nitrospinae bacterium]|nr:sulfurtransferase TusA family protein [Nitrospinota bacterium]
QGIYGQRQDEEQMVRTKLPLGQITSDQLSCLADFGEKYSHGILHVTTRQDIQFHYVKINTVPQGLQDLADHDLTTREACGNTVRNVTACHKAGTCAEETFDVTPYGKAITNYLLRHSLTQNLPRKFKISLGGCAGCGLAPIHDIGLKAVVRQENGRDVRGFKVLIGGGLGSFPHAAKLLTEFIPTENLLRLCEAIVSVFDKYGDKINRNKARLKFVIDKLGMEKTKELFEEEYAALEGKQYDPISVPEESIPEIPSYTGNSEFDNDPDFLLWKTRNTSEQRQSGFFNLQIKLLLGDFDVPQARAISKIAEKYAGGKIVLTVNQNLMIPWVREDVFGGIYGELKKIGLHKAGTEEIRDITCCPGSETCNLGITASRGLVAHLNEKMENGMSFSKDLDGISIKASGCPNSCGQHHIASIGFHGGAKKVNGVLAPHYEIFLGGRVSEDNVIFGTPVIKVPAKNAPDVVRKTLDDYQAKKTADESFGEYFDRQGKKYFKDLLTPLRELAGIEEAPESYIDFGSTEKYSLDDRGQGECAGALTDLIQNLLSDAQRANFQGKLSLEKGNYQEAQEKAGVALVACSRALLTTEGMDFNDDRECLKKFQSLIVDMEIVSPKYADLINHYDDILTSADQEKAEWWLEETNNLADECKQVNDKMQTDKSLRIRVGSADKKSNGKKGTGATNAKIDLLGVKCPFNYVKTKIKLETMESGSTLEVLLDDGEPAENVPRSVQNDGHKLVSLEKENGHFKMIVEKV